ncbi:helix-turn-helix domain-containing protein, partial [bacterium]|nr:helix-turn-helix domain-containing protein [bacterium]
IALCRMADKNQKVYPSQKTLAEKIGVDVATVNNWLGILSYFRIIKKKRVGKQCTNRYYLLDKKHWKPIEKLKEELPQKLQKLSLQEINKLTSKDISDLVGNQISDLALNQIKIGLRLIHDWSTTNSIVRKHNSKETQKKGYDASSDASHSSLEASKEENSLSSSQTSSDSSLEGAVSTQPSAMRGQPPAAKRQSPKGQPPDKRGQLPRESSNSKSQLHKDVVEIFSLYKKWFLEYISDSEPIFNWGQCEKLIRPYLRKFGKEKMIKFLEYYFFTRDKDDRAWFKKNKWSLNCFLSAYTIHLISLAVERMEAEN